MEEFELAEEDKGYWNDADNNAAAAEDADYFDGDGNLAWEDLDDFWNPCWDL